MLKDPEFVAEANKRQWEINPVSGEKLEALAKEVIHQPADMVERMKKVLGEVKAGIKAIVNERRATWISIIIS